MDKSDLVYLYLQREIINHSNNNQILKTRACEILSWFGIPKKVGIGFIKKLEEKNLIRNIDRYKIEIINSGRSNNLKRKLSEIMWEEFL